MLELLTTIPFAFVLFFVAVGLIQGFVIAPIRWGIAGCRTGNWELYNAPRVVLTSSERSPL